MKEFDFYKLIKKRRSIRNYDPKKKIDKTVIERILEAGRIAPTSNNNQPAKIRVVIGEEFLQKIRPSYKREWFENAPAILIITGNKKHAWTRPYDGFNSLEIDLAIMMDHMILAAEYEGVSTCWIIAFDKNIIKNALNLDQDETVLCMTPLGYPEDNWIKPQMPFRKSLDELVQYY
jgi:nitroreductase